jgi:transglutaminase-like putative cysteine protease
MLLSIQHKTHYRYPESVQFTPHRILLRPREHHTLGVESFELRIEPEARVHWMVDAYENQLAVVNFLHKSDEMRVEARLTASLQTSDPFDFIIEPYAKIYPFAYNPHERKALVPYLEVGSPGNCAKVLPWIWREFPKLPESSLEVLTQINRRIHERLQYNHRDEEGVQAPDETLALGSGSCRDFSRLFIEICRQLGFAARFVSGYLYAPPAGNDFIENVAAGSMHAWTQVYIPGAGWKGFDPTNGILENAFFIPCAVANEPKLASPIQGSYYHDQSRIPSTMEVRLSIEELR